MYIDFIVWVLGFVFWIGLLYFTDGNPIVLVGGVSFILGWVVKDWRENYRG